MKLSSKGKVAIISLVDMAIYSRNSCPVKLSEISKRQNISVNFLEQIFFSLKKNGIVYSTRGPSGGYTFAKRPDLVKLYDVINAIDEKLVISNSNDLKSKENHDKNDLTNFLTFNLWNEFNNHIYNFLNGISIEDVKSNNFLKKNDENVEKVNISY